MNAINELIKRATEINLTEGKNSNHPNDETLWEYLVGLFLHEHSYSPVRIKKKNGNKDLDFEFVINDSKLYAECTCVSDGFDDKEQTKKSKLNIADREDSNEQLLECIDSTVEEIHNNVGVRMTSSIFSKHEYQIKPFHTQKQEHPTFIFLNSGGLTNMPSLSDVNSLTPLGVCAPALYGIDGVLTVDPKTGQKCTTQMSESDKNGLKGCNPNPVSRMGFRNHELEHISAVIHSNKRPSDLAEYLFKDYDGSVVELFNNHAEMIVNGCAKKGIALETINQFCGIRTIFIHKEGIVIQQQVQELIKVKVSPTQ